MNSPELKTVGEVLIDLLEANDVDVVFGIPGVHTVELYRGLAGSRIRHVTPRHEQGAGFMADGYARVSGKPGVCLVITGPGLTNILTPMAQAHADSVPMLVISGVNARHTLGHGRGALHELPDQRAMVRSLAIYTHTLLDPADLAVVVEHAFSLLGSSRPGPVHIEIPTDVMAERIPAATLRKTVAPAPRASAELIAEAAGLCAGAERPVILAGGGANGAASEIAELANRLDAPAVTTVNARGLLHDHPLLVPASPSLESVRDLLRASDLVLAIGTQMGPTDYDMYENGRFPALEKLVRIDIDRDQIARGPAADIALLSTAKAACRDLLDALPAQGAQRGGAERAARIRQASIDGLSDKMRREIALLETARKALPGCIMVGDSTQLVYAGNLYCSIDRINGWFNAATGFGALGYGPPAAIGAGLAAPDTPIICIVGDGGIQFTLAELGSAVDEEVPVIFIVWNNGGYQEIKTFMIDNDIEPVGVAPSPPDFLLLAKSYGLHGQRVTNLTELTAALETAAASRYASVIEINESDFRID